MVLPAAHLKTDHGWCKRPCQHRGTTPKSPAALKGLLRCAQTRATMLEPVLQALR